jgi:hypothetical protein
MTTLDSQHFELTLPRQAGGGLDQDEEWCEIELDGERRRIRFHDYAAIYAVPGLYEHLFGELLECSSPEIVCDLLCSELRRAGIEPAELRTLDFGAGNGMVGELLAGCGVRSIVGIDLLPAGRAVYDDYVALDVSALNGAQRAALEAQRFNAMVCVAALGFGDVPPAAFAEVFNLVDSAGWIAFNLRERFLDDDDPAGFGALISRMLEEGVLDEHARRSYTHRLSVTGEPLTYLALVATKRRDLPPAWTR